MSQNTTHFIARYVVLSTSDTWNGFLAQELEKDYMENLFSFLEKEYKNHEVFPEHENIFKAFELTPPRKIRVVILGQDPYHGPKEAMGLAFSVPKYKKFIPPSLQNIYREIERSTKVKMPETGDLTNWAKQGVLLLNSVLTVRAHSPRSHANKGWERFTDEVIAEINNFNRPIIFVLWGRDAQKKAGQIDGKRHIILKAAHPSPLSASRGFFGCDHFLKINAHLEVWGQKPIKWEEL